MPRATEKLRFNITLLKNNCNFSEPDSFIAGYTEDNLERIPEFDNVVLYKKHGTSGAPKWLIAIKDKLLPDAALAGFSPESQSSGLTIFIKVNDENAIKSPLGYRIFAINYGHLGRFNIEEDAVQKSSGFIQQQKF